MSEKSTSVIELLQKNIGQDVEFNGQIWQIVEVLTSEYKLVLQSGSHSTIQNTAFGEARRWTPDVTTVQIFDSSATVTPEAKLIIKQVES